MKSYIVALDLHGTLLDLNWKISAGQETALAERLNEIKDIADVYLCTGNDFSFVESYVPAEVMSHVKGCILESGCVLNNLSQDICLTTSDTIDKASRLQSYLEKKQYPFVKYFGQRKTTVTLFTCDEQSGESPEKYHDLVDKDLKSSEFGEDFYITYSNVALDIVPINHSKWYTLKKIAQDTGEDCKIISFMDSYNDKEVVKYSDYSFLPQNASDSLIQYLRAHTKLIFPVGKFHFFRGIAYLCSEKYTEAVVAGLRFFKHADKHKKI